MTRMLCLYSFLCLVVISSAWHSRPIQKSRSMRIYGFISGNNHNNIPQTINSRNKNNVIHISSTIAAIGALMVNQNIPISIANAAETDAAVAPVVAEAAPIIEDFGSFRLPYFHENLPFKDFLGRKATIVFNMKIDDPQTVVQFPELAEIFRKYSKEGLNVQAFPTEQGWFEPDDDEACRAKAKEYYTFGDVYPNSVVFDKIDLLGPSQHPLYKALTRALPTPNGYSQITLNYEKFLLDSTGRPVRRYPRKLTAYDMEADIIALLHDQPLPPETPLFAKAWREAKREVIKGEYSFRYNYNYYTAPESMYKYDPKKDQV